jgi:acyl-CoA thioesterase FadM
MKPRSTDFVARQRIEPGFVIQRRVAWIDVDRSGYVQIANYVRYAEETEYAFLRSRGLPIIQAAPLGILGFPRVAANVDLIRPLRWDEFFEVAILSLAHDGKQLEYSFQVRVAGEPTASICFRVACCRFPGPDLPYAILLPSEFLAPIFGEG